VKQKLFICLVLTLVTAGIYWPVHQYDFVNYDDAEYVVENVHVRTGLTFDGAKWAFTTGHAGYWLPLTWLSHMMDIQLFGLNAGAHHTVNVLFHIGNSVLLFLLLARVTRALWPSAMVAALFAWHPLHVESVAWIAERKDVLSTFLALLSLGAYARYAESNRQLHLLLSLLCFAAGLTAKPMLVTLPFIFLLLDYWPLQRGSYQSARLVVEKVPFFLLTAVSSIVTYAAQRNFGAVASLESIPLQYRVENALLAYTRYLQKTFWPTNLAIMYPISNMSSPWEIGAALVLLIAISIAVVYLSPCRPWLLVGWFWFVGMLVPTIGLVQVGIQSMADRFTYLPSVGIFLIWAWSSAELAASFRSFSKAVAVLGLVVLITGLLLTSIQLRSWRDSETLFQHAITVTKNNYVAHNMLGRVFADRGRFDEAEAHFEEVLRIFPNQPEAHFSLGVICARKAKFDEALAHYTQAVEIRPDAATHYNLGNVLMKVDRANEAIAHFAEAVRLDPQMAEAQNNWAYALTTQGRLREAANHFAAALQIKPDLLEARLNVARIREQLGQAR